MLGKTPKPDLMLPEKKRQSLSFSDASPKAFQHWVDGLPMGNVGESSRQLYNAIIELNQLELPPPHRLQLLELVRPSIHHTAEQLEQHYLGHPITLPEKQRKIANLCQALQLHLAQGYKQALMDLIDKGAPDKQRPLLALAAHRAISDMGASILRAAQLYSASPLRCWHECHQIYRYMLARQYGEVMVKDSLREDTLEKSSVEDAYKQLLLFGSSRPNQLRQRELKQVYHLFADCTSYTELVAVNGSDTLFVVDTVRDLPPIYRSQLKDRTSAIDLGFETRELAQHLNNYLDAYQSGKKPTANFLNLPYPISHSVLMHLSQSLGTQSSRTSDRIASQSKLQVTLGLSAAHYYCAGQTRFSAFLATSGETTEQNFFLSNAQRNDPWASAFDVENPGHLEHTDTPINYRDASGAVNNGSSRDASYPLHTIPLVNKSPTGYCLKWTSEVPSALQAGEIMALREGRGEPWSIAVIRWIRQFKQEGTHIGVELLATNASPCAARLLQKSGQNSEFLRALLLPPIMESGQAHTLVTPRLPFQPGHRIVLFNSQQSEQNQLSRPLAATGSISQFELKYPVSGSTILGSQNPADSDRGGDDFDSLWPSL